MRRVSGRLALRFKMARERNDKLTDLLVGIKESGDRSPDSGDKGTCSCDGHIGWSEDSVLKRGAKDGSEKAAEQ
jgi:hypothetical protein